MAKGRATKGVPKKAAATAKRHAPRAAAKRPERGPLTEGAERTLKALRDNAQAMGAEAGADWPADTVPNVRAWQKLPAGWRHAVKVTNKSAKSNGGTLHRCFVGPGGLVKWHKKDLEKHLGEQFPSSEGREHARFMSAEVCREFPPKEILRRTAKKDATPYVLKRCDQLNGKTVEFALMKFRCLTSAGVEVDYGISDLRYDIKRGNLEIAGLGKAQNAPNAAAKGASKKARGTAGAKAEAGKAASSAAGGAARKAAAAPASRAAKGAGRGAAGAAAAKGSSAVAGSAAKRSAGPSSSRAASPAAGREDSAAGAKAAAAGALKGAKRRIADEGQLYTLKTAAADLRVERSLADALLNILKMPPSERGAFGGSVMQQFERLLC